MIELIIVRHGQSVADIENRYEGRADFPLTELGRGQASKLASWIMLNYPPDYIISSPLKRASETAEIISKKVGVEVKYDNDLMEMDTGLLAGLLKSEADIRFPKPRDGNKLHEPIWGGESLIDFRARAERFWSKLTCTYNREAKSVRILVVSHGGMINMLFKCFLCLPVNDDVTIYTDVTSVHYWKIGNNRKTIEFLNFKEHLSLSGYSEKLKENDYEEY